jgi:hypothetical protein
MSTAIRRLPILRNSSGTMRRDGSRANIWSYPPAHNGDRGIRRNPPRLIAKRKTLE